MDIKHPIGSAKQAINDKLQGSVATYLRCGGVVNNHIKKGLLLSLWVKFFLNRWIYDKVTSKNVIVSCTFSVFKQCVGQAHKVHETITFLLVTLPNIHRLVFTRRLSYKPFLIWLLTIPPHLKYAGTLPCNLSLIACFADINVSQGSVATYARCGWIFNMHLTLCI